MRDDRLGFRRVVGRGSPKRETLEDGGPFGRADLYEEVVAFSLEDLRDDEVGVLPVPLDPCP